MKLDYEFKQGDYVVCTGLTEDQITSLINRMVECGARRYEDHTCFSRKFNTLSWDEGGDTYFSSQDILSESEYFNEIKWEDIRPKGEGRIMKTLREMYPNGVYTENSPEVFTRFKDLLEDDFSIEDEVDYDSGYYYCGLPADEDLRLVQYGSFDSSERYLTNEDFFAITLDKKVNTVQGGDDLSPTQSIGQLIKQLQQSTKPNSPEIYISNSGDIVLKQDGDYELNVTGKTGAEIDEIYQAMFVLMNV